MEGSVGMGMAARLVSIQGAPPSARSVNPRHASSLRQKARARCARGRRVAICRAQGGEGAGGPSGWADGTEEDGVKPTSKTTKSKDPRYRVRSTYKRGFSWLKFQIAERVRNTRVVKLVLEFAAAVIAEASRIWFEDERARPVRLALERLRSMIRALLGDYHDWDVKRCQKRYLWQISSQQEARVMGHVARFFLGVMLNVSWQMITPWSSLFWALTAPLAVGYVRSVQPIGVQNRPFPLPVVVGFLLTAPFKFGAEIDRAMTTGFYWTGPLAAEVLLLAGLCVLMVRCRNLTYNLRWAEDTLRYLEGLKRERVDSLFK